MEAFVQPVLYEKDGHIATITMNRPEAMNAINVEMIDAFVVHLVEATRDADIRVLIVTGVGRAFCVGADIRQLKKWEQDESLRERFYTAAPRLFRLLEEFPHPVIAAVNGVAAAGGFELCCYADLVVAADDAKIGDAHANFVGFGPISAVVAPYLFPRKIVAELLLTGDMWTAADMKTVGFVNRVVPAGEALLAARALAEQIAVKPPLAMSAAKGLMRRAGLVDRGELLSQAFACAQRNFATRDFAEGLRAFAEKRPPVYVGK
jgi:enoyl-CoA hydratase/carnithine racemase